MKRVDEMETDEAVREMLGRAQAVCGGNVQVTQVQYRNLRWEGILSGDVPAGMHAYLYNDETGQLQFETREEPGTASEPGVPTRFRPTASPQVTAEPEH